MCSSKYTRNKLSLFTSYTLHCSILLFQGISIHYISKRLGYSRVSITLDHYSHILDEMGQVESNKASEIIGEMNEYTMQN